MPIVHEHCGNHSRRTVRRRGDDASSRRVLLIDCQGEQINPGLVRRLELPHAVGRRLIEQVSAARKPVIHGGCASRHIEPTRQHRLPAGASFMDAVAHRAEHRFDMPVDLFGRSYGSLIRPDDLVYAQTGTYVYVDELGRRGEWVGQPSHAVTFHRQRGLLAHLLLGITLHGWGDFRVNRHKRIRGQTTLDESTADRIPHLFEQLLTVLAICREPHAIRMRGETSPVVELDIASIFECDLVFAVQIQRATLITDLMDAREIIRIHRLRLVVFQPDHGGTVSAMPESGQCQRPIERDMHTGHTGKQMPVCERLRETLCGEHGAHGMR